ncbi:unnamed protein product [Closterium sp. Naga37s-1]|nr:unnamed protein product [Closterium sp. Naga37s-1]
MQCNAMQTEDRLPSLEEQGVRQLFPSTKNMSENSRCTRRRVCRAMSACHLSVTCSQFLVPSCYVGVMVCASRVIMSYARAEPKALVLGPAHVPVVQLPCPGLSSSPASPPCAGPAGAGAGGRAGGATKMHSGLSSAPALSCPRPADTRAELKALGRELGLLVLELADVLVERPSQAGRCVEDISLLFTNLHFLLNSLRPHQARATLTHILKTQLDMRKQSLQGIKEQRAAVWEVLRLAVGEVEAATRGEAGGGGSSKGGAEGVEVEGGGGGKQ